MSKRQTPPQRIILLYHVLATSLSSPSQPRHKFAIFSISSHTLFNLLNIIPVRDPVELPSRMISYSLNATKAFLRHPSHQDLYFSEFTWRTSKRKPNPHHVQHVDNIQKKCTFHESGFLCRLLHTSAVESSAVNNNVSNFTFIAYIWQYWSQPKLAVLQLTLVPGWHSYFRLHSVHSFWKQPAIMRSAGCGSQLPCCLVQLDSVSNCPYDCVYTVWKWETGEYE